jgi:hypothetical protein
LVGDGSLKISVVISFQNPEKEGAHQLANELEELLGRPNFKLVRINEIRLRWEKFEGVKKS